jgi:hypothetical protein
MKVKTLIIVAFANFLFAISSCKKVYDYVEQHPTATSDACRIAQFVLSVSNVKLNYNVSYDKKGNMLSIVAEEGAPLYMNFDKYYRYDKQNRLTDYILAYHGNPVPFEWQSYQYFKDKITDTAYVHCGDISSPTPPVNAPADNKFFYEIKKDIWGRVISVTYTSYGTVGQILTQYDSHGNRVTDPVTSYDNKINPYRTNTSLQFTEGDYSANNPVGYYGYQGFSFAKIVNYNAYGLPTKYVALFGYPNNLGMFGYVYDTLEIKYDCDISNVKNY